MALIYYQLMILKHSRRILKYFYIELVLACLEQDLEHQMKKIKEVDKLLWMNIFFCWRLVHLDLDFQKGRVMVF